MTGSTSRKSEPWSATHRHDQPQRGERKGDISSVTTTSGLAWKIPGRAGDSPIVGAGQYTDNDVGAAGSTGLGEANIMVCGGFLTVEHMRQGMKPTDAALATLKRVVAMAPPRLLDERGRPKFQLNFYAVNKAGEFGSAAFFPSKYAVHDGREGRILDAAVLYAAMRAVFLVVLGSLLAGTVAAQEPWRSSYFPYPMGNPSDGAALVFRWQRTRDAPCFISKSDSVDVINPITFSGALSGGSGDRNLRKPVRPGRVRAPGLVDGWRFRGLVAAERQGRFGYYGLGGDLSERNRLPIRMRGLSGPPGPLPGSAESPDRSAGRSGSPSALRSTGPISAGCPIARSSAPSTAASWRPHHATW